MTASIQTNSAKLIRPRVDVTAVVLTRNEQPNIEKCLSSLCWATRVLVVDSNSSDRTRELCYEFPNVSIVSHEFLSHAEQWNFAVKHTSITTQWVLCLDADYEVPPELVAELDSFLIPTSVNGIICRFDYRINGESVNSNIYGSKPVFFRRGQIEFIQQGHTQVPCVEGDLLELKCRLVHDDRKPVTDWLLSQQRYAELEVSYLNRSTATRRWFSKIRRWPRVSVFAVLCYLVIVKGMLFKGHAGFIYLYQRLIAEALIAQETLSKEQGHVDNDVRNISNPFGVRFKRLQAVVLSATEGVRDVFRSSGRNSHVRSIDTRIEPESDVHTFMKPGTRSIDNRLSVVTPHSSLNSKRT